MKKGTIVRSILLVIVIINLVLKYLGKDIIKIDESQVTEIVEMIISVLVIVASWWKNNSFTKKAILSDEVLDGLKALEEETIEDDAEVVEE